MPFPVPATPMDQAPAFKPSRISAGVSPIFAMAASGYTCKRTAHSYIMKGCGRPVPASSGVKLQSGV